MTWHYLTWKVGLNQPTPHLGMELRWEGRTIGVVTEVKQSPEYYEVTTLIDEGTHRTIFGSLACGVTFDLVGTMA